MAEARFSSALESLSPEELRQRLHALESIIARAPVPIAIAYEPDCRFISANHALATLLQLPDDSNISLTPAAGRPPYRIQRDGVDIPGPELPMQYAIAHRQAVSNEIDIVRPDGSVVHVQNDVEPLYDTHGRIYGCVSVCVDITDRKRSEIGLRDAARRKDEFLATLSHELRNPLAPIRTALEVMRLARDDHAVVEQARATMERQVLHLVRITDDLLDVARITQNRIELRRERLDLRSTLHNALETTRVTLDPQIHDLIVELPDQPLWADVDLTRLAQAISNLLNNAVKYTGQGGRIRVSLHGAGATAKITVDDTGIGIPPEMLPRIFDMFTQLQAHRDRTYGGLGIGLSLARRLVELHGGTLEAFSEGVGCGSRFVITLPLAPAEANERLRVSDTRPSPAPGRVLVAEDNADAAAMMRMMLQLNGHDVRVAADGEKAIALAQSFPPDIAFVDIGMPIMDGYEVANGLRRLFGRGVVLVALTGWGQDEDKRRSQEAGFDYHLTKPPEPEVLERLIASSIAARDARALRASASPRQSSAE